VWEDHPSDARRAAGAVYIWVNNQLQYPRSLAKTLGREDLTVVSPGWLDSYQWRGMELTGVLLDHAARLKGDQWDHLFEARARVRRSS
jgi:hypothetical protein